MARATSRAETSEQIQEFEAVSGRANVLGSCDVSLKCAAAGIRLWGASFDLRGIPHFSPTKEAVLAWPAYFSAGGTFQRFLPHSVKACLFLVCGLRWGPIAASQASRSLAKGGDAVCAPRPAATGRLFREILRYSGLSDEFMQALRATLAFPPGVQSECSPLVRRLPTE